MKKDGDYEFKVSDPASKTSATLILSSLPNEKVLGKMFDFFKTKISQAPDLLGDGEEQELAELEGRSPSTLDQQSYERLTALQGKRKRALPIEDIEIDEGEPMEEPPKKPAAEEIDTSTWPEEDKKLATMNKNLMTQAQWERYRNLTQKRKEAPKTGGILSSQRRRPGAFGKES